MVVCPLLKTNGKKLRVSLSYEIQRTQWTYVCLLSWILRVREGTVGTLQHNGTVLHCMICALRAFMGEYVISQRIQYRPCKRVPLGCCLPKRTHISGNQIMYHRKPGDWETNLDNPKYRHILLSSINSKKKVLWYLGAFEELRRGKWAWNYF